MAQDLTLAPKPVLYNPKQNLLKADLFSLFSLHSI
jgi:hypothetical protein